LSIISIIFPPIMWLLQFVCECGLFLRVKDGGDSITEKVEATLGRSEMW